MKRLTGNRQTDRTAEETAEVGRQVQSLIEHPGWEYLLEELDAKADATINQVVSPRWNVAEYADAIGVAKGLRYVAPAADLVIKKGRKAQDEAHQLDAAGQVAQEG